MAISSSSFSANEATKALRDAQEFSRNKEFSKALERHEWYHDNALRVQPSQYGVRLSFALSYWKELGEVYPPALKSLQDIRDNADESLRKGVGGKELFHDLLSVNRTLKEPRKTIELFRFLDEHFPIIAKECFGRVDDLMVELNEIDLFIKYAGDFKLILGKHIQIYKSMLSHMTEKAKDVEHDQVFEGVTKTLKKRGSDLSSVALEIGEVELSEELQSMTDEATK